MNKTTKNILIVEDDLCLKLLMARLFAAIDPTVYLSWSTTVEEAEEELLTQDFDVIISDQFLPGSRKGLDLWTLCRRLCPRTRFVLMSTAAALEDRRMAAAPEKRPLFLQKPFGIAECQRVILTDLTGRAEDHV